MRPKVCQLLLLLCVTGACTADRQGGADDPLGPEITERDASSETDAADPRDTACGDVGAPCMAAGACGAGIIECDRAGQPLCSTAVGGSDDRSASEVCNGFDEDCDGEVDEDYLIGLSCVGVGACPDGILACHGPDKALCSTHVNGSDDRSTPESCNGVDDDCDGQTDEDAQDANRCGQCGDEPPEQCDELDNDCDGEIDEEAIDFNACGGCGDPPEERCNELDDDCDGETDESPVDGNACGHCGPLPLESCNSTDDDCDGQLDEDTSSADWSCVPAGSFAMGSPGPECPGPDCVDPRCPPEGEQCPDPEPRRDSREPQHRVQISRALLVKTREVTQREWLSLLPTNPSQFPNCGLDCPVERITWFEAAYLGNAWSRAEGLAECYRFSGCEASPDCSVEGCQDIALCQAGEAGPGDLFSCRDGQDNDEDGLADCDDPQCALTSGCGAPAQVDDDATLRCLAGREMVCAEVEFEGLGCHGYRLPSEAEWEYSARAGSPTATYNGEMVILGENNIPVLDPIAWYTGNSGVDYEGGIRCGSREWVEMQYPADHCGPHPVAAKRPNDWGLYDILGNVHEWVWDRYSNNYGGTDGLQIDPVGPEAGRNRVYKGGAWHYPAAWHSRAALRDAWEPALHVGAIGVRLVRTEP